jgi:hypothetical protein
MHISADAHQQSLECKHSQFELQPLTPLETNQSTLAALWRLELPVPHSRTQCLQLLFLFEVSPLVQSETAPAVLTPARDAWCIYRLAPAGLSVLYSTGSAVTCVFCCLKTAELGDITIRADGSATLVQKFM